MSNSHPKDVSEEYLTVYFPDYNWVDSRVCGKWGEKSGFGIGLVLTVRVRFFDF